MKKTLAMIPALLLIVGAIGVVEAQTRERMATARTDERGIEVDTRSARQSVRKSEPITERRRLQRRLGISAERAKVIITGERGKKRVLSFLAPGPDGSTGYTCKAAGCACFGDQDCNLMFTQVCADPDTNGSCSGEPPVCTCHP